MTAITLAGSISGPIREAVFDAAVQCVRPYEPRRITRDLAAALNRLCRRRAPLALMLEGLAVALWTEPVLVDPGQAADFVGRPALDLGWRLDGGERVSLTVPQGLVERMLAALDPGLPRWPYEPARSLLIELALAPLLARIEQHLGPMALVEAQPARTRDFAADDGALGFRGTLDGVPFRALLHGGSLGSDRGSVLERIARAVEDRLGRGTPADAPDLPILVQFQAGTMRLSVGALSKLRTGDVLVPDDFPIGRNEITVVAGRRRAGTARAVPSGFSLHERLRPVRTAPMEFPMTDDDRRIAPDGTGDDGSLDDLDVTLAFELGRRLIDLAELRSIAPGYVFPLTGDASAPVDILANGRRIGRGEIVRIGETLGVRATRLFGHE
jgi:type III secretion protein Q